MKNNLLTIINLIRLDNGVTYSLNTGETNPPDGYMVSISKHERRIKTIDEDVIRDYLREKAHLLTPPNRYFGVWLDGDEYVLDISEKAETRDIAVFLGKRRKQKAIWDNSRKDEIILNYERPS